MFLFELCTKVRVCGGGEFELCVLGLAPFLSHPSLQWKVKITKTLGVNSFFWQPRGCFSRCVTNNHAAASPQCSRNCEGGSQSREVTCVDMRDQRPLRPFHCRAVASRPPTQLPCNLQPCLDWYASSWGQVSHRQDDGVVHACLDTLTAFSSKCS